MRRRKKPLGRTKPPEEMVILTVKVPKSVKKALFKRGNVSERVRELLAVATYPDRMAMKRDEPDTEGLVV